MNTVIESTLLVWLLGYTLHSTLLLGLAWLLDAGGFLKRSASRALAWKGVAFGALLTASVQTFAPGVSLTEMPRAVSAVMPSTTTARDTATTHKQAPTFAQPAPETVPLPAVRSASIPAASISNVESGTGTAGWILIAWLLTATLLMLRLANTMRHALRAMSMRKHITDGPMHDSLVRLHERANTDARRKTALPKLSFVTDLNGPLTLPSGEICLPHWSVELAAAQRDAMLAHELAHVIQRDAQWQLLLTVLGTVFFFQPLNRIARNRVAACAELSADNLAVELTGSGRPLAEVLAACAERFAPHDDHAMLFTAAMAQRRSPLLERVERALGGLNMNDHKPSRTAFALSATAIVSALLLLPTMAEQPNAAEREKISIRGDSDKNELRYEITKDGQSLRIEVDGDVRFAADEKDIESLSRNGRFAIVDKRGGETHELVVTQRNGQLLRSFRLNGADAPYDNRAREWLATVIPVVLRNTALDAERRVKRMLDDGGVEPVIKEIATIDSSFAKARYVSILLDNAGLTNEQARSLLDALKNLTTDFEMRNAFAKIATIPQLDAPTQALLLRRAMGIRSDFETAELLRQITPGLANDEAVLSAWRERVERIGSDFEMRRVLSDVFQGERMSPGWQSAALKIAAEHIGSDFELRSLLEKAAPAVGRHADLFPAYVAALKTIGSDFEAREALRAVVRAARLDTENYSALLDAVRSIGSDFERSQALQAIARDMPREAALVEKYRGIAGTLSAHERSVAERALDRG